MNDDREVKPPQAAEAANIESQRFDAVGRVSTYWPPLNGLTRAPWPSVAFASPVVNWLFRPLKPEAQQKRQRSAPSAVSAAGR